MDDKPNASRRPSGSGEKQKGKSSNKKKRKNKAKERERKRTAGKTETKTYSPEETNSDSALDWAKRHSKGPKSHSSDSRTKYNNKNSLASLHNSTGVSSAPVLGSRIGDTSRVSLLERQAVQDIHALFTSKSEPNKVRASTSQSSADSEISEIVDMVDESLRWDNVQSDADDEVERIRVYKMNRRKRYLVDAYQKREDKEGVLKLAREIATCNDDD